MNKIQRILHDQARFYEYAHQMEACGGTILDSSLPVNIQTVNGQESLKQTLFRLKDELDEVMEEAEKITCSTPEFKEELIDVLAFTINLMIQAGYDFRRFGDIDPLKGTGVPLVTFNLVTLRAQFCHVNSKCRAVSRILKNKPWRKTHTPVSKEQLESALSQLLVSVVGMCLFYMTPDEVSSRHSEKVKKNWERQDNGY